MAAGGQLSPGTVILGKKEFPLGKRKGKRQLGLYTCVTLGLKPQWVTTAFYLHRKAF